MFFCIRGFIQTFQWKTWPTGPTGIEHWAPNEPNKPNSSRLSHLLSSLWPLAAALTTSAVQQRQVQVAAFAPCVRGTVRRWPGKCAYSFCLFAKRIWQFWQSIFLWQNMAKYANNCDWNVFWQFWQKLGFDVTACDCNLSIRKKTCSTHPRNVLSTPSPRVQNTSFSTVNQCKAQVIAWLRLTKACLARHFSWPSSRFFEEPGATCWGHMEEPQKIGLTWRS